MPAGRSRRGGGRREPKPLAAADPTAPPLHRDRAVLLVVDLQEKLLSVVFEPTRVVRQARALLRAARELALPVLFTTQSPESLGPVAPELAAEAPESEPIDKLTFDCFGSPAFRSRLAALAPRRQLLVCGTESHVCVVRTVAGARRAGFEAHVAADAVSAIAEENWWIGLARMARDGAVVSNVDAAIAELRASVAASERTSRVRD